MKYYLTKPTDKWKIFNELKKTKRKTTFETQFSKKKIHPITSLNLANLLKFTLFNTEATLSFVPLAIKKMNDLY